MGDHRQHPNQGRPQFVIECDERERVNGAGYCKVCCKLIPKRDGSPHRGRLYCSNECRALVETCWKNWLAEIDRMTLIRDANYTCANCGDRFSQFDLEIDHIVALCNAPRDVYYWSKDNLQVLCKKCHKKKTKHDVAEMKRKQAQEVK